MDFSFAVVVGPQGCGKTLHSVQIARQLGVGRIVDDCWCPSHGLVDGALHITHEWEHFA